MVIIRSRPADMPPPTEPTATDDAPAALDVEYPKALRTRTGIKLEVRPIEPEDAAGLRDGYAALSDESKRARFHTAAHELSDAQLRYLTEIDHDTHEALVAEAETKAGDHGVAVTRYVRLDDEPEVAEVAITVADDFQDQGVGSAVFDELSQLAYRRGVRWFRGWVLPSNRRAVDFFTSRGAASRYREGLIVVELPLPFPEPFRPHRWLPPQTRLYRWVRKLATRDHLEAPVPPGPPDWTMVRLTSEEAADVARALEAHGDRFDDLAARFRHVSEIDQPEDSEDG
jgi:GNAT superfamily N-acetyltransferase